MAATNERRLELAHTAIKASAKAAYTAWQAAEAKKAADTADWQAAEAWQALREA